MSPRHPLGQVVRDGERIGLRYERQFAHPFERMWRALTESDQLAHWMPCDIVGDRRAGAEIAVPFWPAVAAKYAIEQPTLSGRILAWDPPTTFSWMWDADVLIFELERTDAGTRMVFTTWIADFTAGLPSIGAGYHVCLDQLADLVDGEVLVDFLDRDPAGYEVLYASIDKA